MISVRTGRKIGCVGHDCGECAAAARERKLMLEALEAAAAMHAMPGGVYRDQIGAMRKVRAAIKHAKASA